MKTWCVLSWENRPVTARKLALVCPCCGTEAELPVGYSPGASLIAAIGLMLIFDPPGYKPPPGFMPDEIKCRYCRKIFSAKESADVR